MTVDGAATLTVNVLDWNGVGAAVLATGLPVPVGRVDLFWDGRQPGGNQRDGEYTVRARAVDGTGATSEATAQVVVDTEPPRVAWRGRWAQRVRSGTLPLALALADEASPRMWLALELTDQTGTPLARYSPSPKPAGSHRVGWHPRNGLPPGAYRVVVTATDEAGNARTTRPRPYLVERVVSPRTVARFDGVGRRVALTFDDCNSPSAWLSLLATLRARGFKAAFFCPGRQVLAAPDVAERTIRDGRTDRGPRLGPLRTSGGSPTAERCRGSSPTARPGGGSRRLRRCPSSGRRTPATTGRRSPPQGRAGFSKIVLWDVDPSDYTQPGAGVIASRVLHAVRPGSIVLMHVTWQTVSALPEILRGLRSRGLRPAGLAELMHQGRPSAAHWPSY